MVTGRAGYCQIKQLWCTNGHLELRVNSAINANAEVNLRYDVLGQLVGEHTQACDYSAELRHKYELTQ